ncbi:MAG: hypothetical protein EA353_05740 [Puniceicoccaceae bacterium]|nr:MAG: hypothetical protein EA353_05740 [Puniceicoccaceae bacterium]
MKCWPRIIPYSVRACLLGTLLAAGLGAAESLEERVERLRHELVAAERELAAANEASVEELAPVEAAELAQALNVPIDALVIVASDQGQGSGFLAEIRGRRFLVTNIHVLGSARQANFLTAEGQTLSFGDIAFISRQRDLAIIPLDWDGPVFEALASVRDQGISIGDAVTVIGNSDGGGVATRVTGKIMGIGPHEVEVDASFIPGNSGSPIIHDKSGLVVGIASYVRNMDRSSWTTSGTTVPTVRRFGYRLDGDVEWDQISLDALWRQGEAFERYEKRTRSLIDIAYHLMYERRILSGYRTDNEIGYMFGDIGNNFHWNRGTASASNVRLLENFIRQLRTELQRDRADARRVIQVDHYRKRFEELDAARVLFDQRLSNFRL